MRSLETVGVWAIIGLTLIGLGVVVAVAAGPGHELVEDYGAPTGVVLAAVGGIVTVITTLSKRREDT